MKELISVFLVASAASVLSQTMTHRQTEFQFVSMTRAEKVAADIGRIRPEMKGEPTAERESAPTGQKFVVLRFSLPYAPQANARRADAKLSGTVPERIEPQIFKCVSTHTWVPVNGTWSAAFVFLVPDEASLVSFQLGKDQTLDVSGMEHATAITKQ